MDQWWADFPDYLGSPPSSPFHGFGPEEDIPSRLVIQTEIVDGEEVFGGIEREKGEIQVPGGVDVLEDTDKEETKRRGRQREVEQLGDVCEKRTRESAPPKPHVWRTRDTAPTTPKATPDGTGSRPVFYLLGSIVSTLKQSKIPTKGAVLGRFLTHLASSSVREAAATTRQEVKAVWFHHFGCRLIEGKELGIEEEGEEKRRIIRTDRHIDDIINGKGKQEAC